MVDMMEDALVTTCSQHVADVTEEALSTAWSPHVFHMTECVLATEKETGSIANGICDLVLTATAASCDEVIP